MLTSQRKTLLWWSWILLVAALGLFIAIYESPKEMFVYGLGIITESFLSVDNAFLLIVVLTGIFPRKKDFEKLLLLSLGAAIIMRIIVIEFGFFYIKSIPNISLISGIIFLAAAACCFFFQASKEGDKGDKADKNILTVLANIIKKNRALFFGKARIIFIPLFIVGLEIINMIMSVDSISALIVTSDRPLIVGAASLMGIIFTRLFAFSDNCMQKILKFRKFAAVLLIVLGVKQIFF